MDLDAIAAALVARRDELGIPWAEIARRAGIDVATLHTIRRRSNRPRPETLRGVSEALGWPPDTLAAVGRGVQPPSDPSVEERLAALELRVAALEQQQRDA
jgi:transcriptional regulator with XRE-family HTH domain